MREFAIGDAEYYFATVFGIALFISNFVIVFESSLALWQYIIIGIFTVIYFSLIFMVMFETTEPIQLLSEEQLKNNEIEYN